MKEKDGRVEDTKQQIILFVEKEDGSYGPIKTGSYLARNYLGFYFQGQDTKREDLLEKLLSGTITPVGFYMEMFNMTEYEVASRAGISKFRLKRHLNPRNYGKIKVSMLERYSRIFNVPVTGLLQIIRVEGDIFIKNRKAENIPCYVTEISVNTASPAKDSRE